MGRAGQRVMDTQHAKHLKTQTWIIKYIKIQKPDFGVKKTWLFWTSYFLQVFSSKGV